MGCDIHLYVERRVNGKWESADTWTPNKYYDADEVARGESNESPLTVEYDDRFYKDRNYDLFAILADVRNGRGFAGVKTGEGFNIIAPPRGLPADVTPEVKAESDKWDGDGHSHSYHTVADLVAFDWLQVAWHQGYVDCTGYRQWRYGGSPQNWCGDVSGSIVRKVTNEEMQNIISERTDSDHPHTYTLVKWGSIYAASCVRFLSKTLPRLRELGTPEDVRIVFWFDN